MRLYKDLKHAMGDVSALSCAIAMRVPFLIASCSALLIASQLSKMAAFLIPLKVLFVAGSGKVPNYLISILGDVSFEELVYGLSVIAVCLYIAHLIIDFGRSHLEQLAMKKLLPSGHVVLMDGRSLQLKKAVEHVARMLSSIVFSLVIAVGLSFFVEGLVGLLGLYLATAFFVYGGYYQLTKLKPSELSKQIPFHVGVFSALGFLGGFGFILLKVIAGDLVPVIVAVLGLILLRLLMNQVSGAFRSGVALSNNFDIYNRLLSGNTLAKTRTAGNELISSLESGVLSLSNIWQASGIDRDILGYQLMDSGFGGVALVKVDSSRGRAATVKVYAKGARPAGEREQRVLQFLGGGEKAPRVLSELTVEGHLVRIFDHAPAIDSELSEFRQYRFTFLSGLMALELPKNLLALSITENKPIHRRIDLMQIVSLLVKSNSLEGDFDELGQKWPQIQRSLDYSPLQLVVRAAPGTLGLLENQQVVCNHWEHWSIEPVGAVWDGAELPGSMLELLSAAKISRPAIDGLAIEQLQLVHALCRLEASMSLQRFSVCAEAVLHINTYVEALDPLDVAA